MRTVKLYLALTSLLKFQLTKARNLMALLRQQPDRRMHRSLWGCTEVSQIKVSLALSPWDNSQARKQRPLCNSPWLSVFSRDDASGNITRPCSPQLQRCNVLCHSYLSQGVDIGEVCPLETVKVRITPALLYSTGPQAGGSAAHVVLHSQLYLSSTETRVTSVTLFGTLGLLKQIPSYEHHCF